MSRARSPKSRTPSPEIFQLAQIAAPFAAAGKTEAEAIGKAQSLLRAARASIERLRELDLGLRKDDAETCDINGACEALEVKDRDTVRNWLFRVMPRDEAETTWRAALAGERCFAPWLIEKIRIGRQQAYVDRAMNREKKKKVLDGG